MASCANISAGPLMACAIENTKKTNSNDPKLESL
jgi:hypothetical protein